MTAVKATKVFDKSPGNVPDSNYWVGFPVVYDKFNCREHHFHIIH